MSKLKLSLIILASFSFFMSCEKSEIKESNIEYKGETPLTVITRSAGDGKKDLLGYGYNCLYALANNYRGALNQVVDIERFEKGEGIDPQTGLPITVPVGKVEVAIGHGDFVQYETYGTSLSDFYSETSSQIEMNTGGILSWGKIELSQEYDSKINEKLGYSFYKVDLCRNVKRLYFNTFSVKRLKYFLTRDFLFALNNYTAKEIVDDYGTHVLTDIYVGGKLSVLTSTMETDKTQKSLTGFTSDILSMFKTKDKESVSQSSSMMNTTFSLVQHGGSEIQSIHKTLGNNGAITADIFDWDRWINSVNENTSTLIHSDLEKMIPIWEFIDSAQLKQEVIDEIKRRSGSTEDENIPLPTILPSFVLKQTNATKKGFWKVDNYSVNSNMFTLNGGGATTMWTISADLGNSIMEYIINGNKSVKKDGGFGIPNSEVQITGSNVTVGIGRWAYSDSNSGRTAIRFDSNYWNKGKGFYSTNYTDTVIDYLIVKNVSGNSQKIPIYITFRK